jgi:hypothetical protein
MLTHLAESIYTALWSCSFICSWKFWVVQWNPQKCLNAF